MNHEKNYVIQTDIKFGAMEKIDIDALQKACPHDWFNQTLCRVSDSMVRLGIVIALLLLLFGHAFSVEETIIYKKPFILHKLVGTIYSEGGGWPENVASSEILFRLIGPGESKEVWRINIDNSGHFNVKLPEGSYKFSIEVFGWDDAEGIVIITKKANKRKRFSITLGLS